MAHLGYLEIILAAVCFLVLWTSKPAYKGLPWSWPVVRMLPGLLSRVGRIHETCTEVLGLTDGTFLFKGVWFANMDMLATVDPANVHHILSANFSNFPKGPKFRNIFDVLGDGIFNSDLDSWKNQRKIARALINHQQFHRFLVKTSRDKVEKGLIPILDHFSKQEQVMDIQDLFQRLTFDSSCILFTGYDPGCLSLDFPDVPFMKAVDAAEEAIFMRHVVPESLWKLQRWLNIGEEKKMHKAWVTLDHVISKYISMKRAELSLNKTKEDQEEGFDLLTSYINEEYEIKKNSLVHDQSQTPFNMGFRERTELKPQDKLLRDNILNLMIAGRDTTSSGLTWFLWLVSTHPQVKVKIREELKSAIPSKEPENRRLFNTEELSKMVYLHGALCESLRLYPPVPFQHKEPLQPDTLPSGHHVHPKMKVMFSLYAMGRMASIWGDDCLDFKPERWISERGTIKHEPSYKFLAFNAGPRTCLGKEVAFTQMKVAAAAVIHNYDVEVVEGHLVEPNVSIILYMKYGLKVRVTKRWS
ncbi:unnamed protein product [Ilex paraguariensis]|uniref:Alkane hydroxylase MAH1-like n=1 Tax=Ilex paraguariensis TaxID=185542 RepID=A0ABC8QXE8_9AQUA